MGTELIFSTSLVDVSVPTVIVICSFSEVASLQGPSFDSEC